MKKTLTVNLGGIVFNIDEDAFDVLKNYLDTIRGYFDSSEGRDEIMTDIESRIAEMLQEKMPGSKEVVNSADINEVISVMGQPEDYISDDLDEDEPTAKKRAHQSNQNQYTRNQSTYTKRRLYRDTDSRMLGGVCSGIGYYFGIDPMWIRLTFAIAMIFFGTGFLLYVVLWIIMPAAVTSAEKLAMKGEPVTFDNIGKTVEEEMENLKKKINNIDGEPIRRTAGKVETFATRVLDFIINIVKLIFKVIGKFLGFFLIFVSAIVLLSLLVGTFSPFNNVFFDSDYGTVGYSLSEMSHLFFNSGGDYWLTTLGIVLLVGIPFLGLMLGGFSLLFNIRAPKYTGLAMAGAWVIGLFLAAAGGLSSTLEFSKESSVSEDYTLVETKSDTLFLELLDHQKKLKTNKRKRAFYEYFRLEDGILTTDGVLVDVLPTNAELPHLEVIKEARGNQFEDAENRASKIDYHILQENNTVKLDPYFSFNADDKWRVQKVKVNIYLPNGKTLFIPKSFKYLLFDVDNYHGTYDKNMVDHYWTMTDSGLISTDIMKEIEEEDTPFEALGNEDNKELEITVNGNGEKHSIVIK